MPYLDRGNGVRIYFEDSGGSDLPILLAHGFGASTAMWAGQVTKFLDRYRLITWDMRGHGRTECPEDLSFFGQDETVDDMCAVLDRLDIRKAVIGGHSLGGFMSLAFNARYPERVAATGRERPGTSAPRAGPDHWRKAALTPWAARGRSARPFKAPRRVWRLRRGVY
jgi:pimeloyl-ACP methyl ester carboxylesterase